MLNIIERGKAFVQWLRTLASRSRWEWRECPYCGSEETCKWGKYERRPWFLSGRQRVQVQRHRCGTCGRTYSEERAELVRRSCYAREVQRYAIDWWQHGGSSLRRVAEMVRSWIGKQERYRIWHPLAETGGEAERCSLSASTLQRWLARAGQVAEKGAEGQLAGLVTTEVVGTDGLWVRLRGGAKRVVLMVADSVSGVLWPPMVVAGEESRRGWHQLRQRVAAAGLNWDGVRSLTSDGARGLLGYLRQELPWVLHQRCVWHLWRNLGQEIAQAARQAAADKAQEVAQAVRERVEQELTRLTRAVVDAATYAQAEQALASLGEHAWGAQIATRLQAQLDALLIHTFPYAQGTQRVTPEWCWRDFRLRLSRGRNHGSAQRFQSAALVWSIYRNFTPAQPRSERKRRYRYPGQSPFQVAGVSLEAISYLDALEV